jgi:hypothetical protein
MSHTTEHMSSALPIRSPIEKAKMHLYKPVDVKRYDSCGCEDRNVRHGCGLLSAQMLMWSDAALLRNRN